MPLLVVAAVYAIRELLRQRARWVRVVGVAGAVAALVVPAVVTAPVAGVREEAGQLALVHSICAQVGSRGAVLEVDEPARGGYAQTMRSYCGVPSIGLPGATPAQLAQVRQNVQARGLTLYALALDAQSIPFVGGQAPPPFYAVTTTRWASTLHGPPTKAAKEPVTVYLARVRPDGFAEPLTRGR
jgi:hypothetical protein